MKTPNTRVDIKAILRDPKLKAKLVDGITKAIIQVGRDGTRLATTVTKPRRSRKTTL